MPRKLMKFLILFDNTSLLYFPGQFLSGRVLLELQDDTPALGNIILCNKLINSLVCFIYFFNFYFLNRSSFFCFG